MGKTNEILRESLATTPTNVILKAYWCLGLLKVIFSFYFHLNKWIYF